MLVIGEKEAESGTSVAVRSRDKGDMGSMLLVEFISFIKQHIYLRRDDY